MKHRDLEELTCQSYDGGYGFIGTSSEAIQAIEAQA